MKVRWLHKPPSVLPQSNSCLAFYHLIILDQSFISCLNWFIFLMKLLCWREGDICWSSVYYTWDSFALKFPFDILPHAGQKPAIISGFVFFSVHLITQMFQVFQSQGFLSRWKANGESTGVLSEGTNTHRSVHQPQGNNLSSFSLFFCLHFSQCHFCSFLSPFLSRKCQKTHSMPSKST